MGGDKLAKNTPRCICPNCLPNPKILGFQWKRLHWASVVREWEQTFQILKLYFFFKQNSAKFIFFEGRRWLSFAQLKKTWGWILFLKKVHIALEVWALKNLSLNNHQFNNWLKIKGDGGRASSLWLFFFNKLRWHATFFTQCDICCQLEKVTTGNSVYFHFYCYYVGSF